MGKQRCTNMYARAGCVYTCVPLHQEVQFGVGSMWSLESAGKYNVLKLKGPCGLYTMGPKWAFHCRRYKWFVLGFPLVHVTNIIVMNDCFIYKFYTVKLSLFGAFSVCVCFAKGF